MKAYRTIAEIREALEPRRTGSIGLVPTMGALHEGHLSLLRAARAENETVVMSLFVNPAQFGDESDLAGYPRDHVRDLALAEEAGVDLAFTPTTDEMYPPGFQTWVDVTELVPPAVATAGQEKVNPAALPLDGYLDEVVGLLTEEPSPREIVVEAAKRLRWAERDGTYADLLEARSQSLASLPGR